MARRTSRPTMSVVRNGQITPRTSADHGEVRWDATVTNADGEPVATYDVLTLVVKEWPPATSEGEG